MKYAICLICHTPHVVWCEFLNSFKYEVYFIVDDNRIDLKGFKEKYKNIKFIQIKEEQAIEEGFTNSSPKIGPVAGWDKALFHFSKSEFDFVWFFEDDVFFYGEETILNIDKKYDGDLLSASYVKNKYGTKISWRWAEIDINISPPWYRGMMCAVRMSKAMLNSIKSYAEKNKSVFFIEAMFPTIAIKNDLNYQTPQELEDVVWRRAFNKSYFQDITKIYHPIRCKRRQSLLRSEKRFD